MSLVKVSMKAGGGAKRNTSLEQGAQVFTATQKEATTTRHRHTEHWALRNSVEVLTSFYTHRGETRGEGQTAAQMHDLELKIVRAPRASTRHNYEARRKSLYRIRAHDPRTPLTSIGPISTVAKLHLATFKLIANGWARGRCLWKRVVVLSEMLASKGPRTMIDEGPAPYAKPDQAPSCSSEET